MSKKIINIISVILNLFIYSLAAAAAPYIFTNVHDRKIAAFMAGGVFMIVALRAVKLSLVRPYHKAVARFFMIYLFALLVFWAWRLMDSRMLGEVFIFGINAYWLHHFFTGLYLTSFILLVVSEFTWLWRKLKGP